MVRTKMTTAALLAVVGVSALAAAAGEEFYSGNQKREIMERASADMARLPFAVQRNFTFENLRKHMEVASTHVTYGGMELVQGMKIDPSVIWQIGKELWTMVEDNTPQSNISINYAGAVPKGVSDWTQMGGWKDYTSKQFNIEFKNGVGMKLTQYEWVWSFKYGGSYSGKGQYVTQASPVTQTAYAYLSEHLDVSTKAYSPVNYGTPEAPIGGITIEVQVTSHGYFKRTTRQCTITARGDGQMEVVTCDSN